MTPPPFHPTSHLLLHPPIKDERLALSSYPISICACWWYLRCNWIGSFDFETGRTTVPATPATPPPHPPPPSLERNKQAQLNFISSLSVRFSQGPSSTDASGTGQRPCLVLGATGPSWSTWISHFTWMNRKWQCLTFQFGGDVKEHTLFFSEWPVGVHMGRRHCGGLKKIGKHSFRRPDEGSTPTAQQE